VKPLFDRYVPEPRTWRVLRDKWVTLRSIQHCALCKTELPHYEQARLEVVAGPGEFWSVYSCWKCNDGKSQGHGWTRGSLEETGEMGSSEIHPASEEEAVL